MKIQSSLITRYIDTNEVLIGLKSVILYICDLITNNIDSQFQSLIIL